MDCFLEPGTRVRRTNIGDEISEEGVVVHCWFDDEIVAHDCYVAFFEGTIPAGKPSGQPYVLRYASTSLVVING